MDYPQEGKSFGFVEAFLIFLSPSEYHFSPGFLSLHLFSTFSSIIDLEFQPYCYIHVFSSLHNDKHVKDTQGNSWGLNSHLQAQEDY